MRSTLASLWCLPLTFITASAYADANQRWVFVKNQMRYKQNSAYCAAVGANKVQDGTAIVLWHCMKGASEQEWELGADGLVRLKSNPSFCLSAREGKAADGTEAILWTCGQSHEYKWKLEDEHLKFDVDQRYWLSVSQDILIDGQKIILWSGHTSGLHWLISSDTPHIKLKANPSLCASVKSGKMDNGQGLILSACGPSDSRGQGWELVNGHLKSKTDSSRCLTVRQGYPKDSAEIILWECGDGSKDDQGWTVDGEHIRFKNYRDYCLAIDDHTFSGTGSKLVLYHCDVPHEEDAAGMELHKQTHGETHLQKHTFKWKIGADGGMRSVIDPRYCASVKGNHVTDGQNIIMWHCGMEKEGRTRLGDEYEWQVEGKIIKLKRHPQYCMSVRQGKHGNGADLILWSCGTGNAYRFDVEDHVIKYHADPSYHVAVRGGRLKDGSDVILWSGYSNGFLFKFDKDRIKLKVDDAYCMSVRMNKVGDGSDVILWTCGTEEAMNWKVTGDHIVQADNPDYCLSVRQNDFKDGADLILWTCNDDDNSQKWVVMGDRIRYKAHPEYCVTVRDGRGTDGSNFVLWSCDEKLADDDEL